jgi:hypothetical protein
MDHVETILCYTKKRFSTRLRIYRIDHLLMYAYLLQENTALVTCLTLLYVMTQIGNLSITNLLRIERLFKTNKHKKTMTYWTFLQCTRCCVCAYLILFIDAVTCSFHIALMIFYKVCWKYSNTIHLDVQEILRQPRNLW